MLAVKPAAALLLLGVGGLLGIQEAPPSTLSASPLEVLAPQAAPAPQAGLPDAATLRAGVTAALSAQVRADLDDLSAEVALQNVDLQRASLRTLELTGDGAVHLPVSAPIPLRFVAVYDLIEHRLERVEYTARPATAPSPVADDRVRRALAQRIGQRLSTDFRDQPTHFQLLSVERIDYGRHRLRLEGAGLTDFGAEGVVYTPFVAIMDKRGGELVELTYDLLDEAPGDAASTALADR